MKKKKKKNTLKCSCQDIQNDVKCPEKWFGKLLYVCVCVCMYVKTLEHLSFCISGPFLDIIFTKIDLCIQIF